MKTRKELKHIPPATAFIPIILPGMNQIVAIAKKHPKRYWEMKKQLEADICMFISEQITTKFPGAVYIVFTWVEKNRRRDPDNVAAGKKFLLDALQKEGVLSEDNWKVMAGWEDRFKVSRDNPGVQLVITDDVQGWR